MTNRRIKWIALTFAVLVQAGFVAGYSRMTDGCFCATSGAPDPTPAPPHVVWATHAAAYPLVLVGTVGGSRASAFGAAAINGLAWFAGTCLLLNVLVGLARIRMGRPRDPRLAGAGRIYLGPRGEASPRWVTGMVLALAASALISGALHRRWWLAESDRAVHAAIAAARTGGQPPAGLALTVNGGVIEDDPPSFGGPYILERDPESDGTHPLDRFVPPDGRHGWLRFRNGKRFSYFVFREPTGWEVSIHSPIQ